MSRISATPPAPTHGGYAAVGVPWSDGQMTVRVRGLGSEPGRIVRLRRPFALIGRHPGADIRIEDRAAAPLHALLVLDRRGVFCVDLLSRTGTRFAGREFASAWLGAGDAIEVAGRRLEILQLRADGATIDPTPGDDDPFAPAGPDLAPVSLRPIEPEAPPWIIGSSLAFLGRGPACVLRVRGSGAAPIHCALWREPSSVRLINLLGRTTRVNDRPVEGSSHLEDGDVLTIGQARFVVGIERFAATNLPARIEPQAAPIAVYAEPSRPALAPPEEELAASDIAEVMAFLRQFQSDAATLLEGQFDQIHALRRELAALRDDLRADRPAPPEVHLPFDIAVPSNPAPSTAETAAWLLGRINDLEPESRPAWKSLIGRISLAVKGIGSSENAEGGTAVGPGSSQTP